MKHLGGETFDVRFRAQPGDVPPFIRLKHLLKLAGRSLGLRCVNVATAPPGLPPARPGDAEAAREPSERDSSPGAQIDQGALTKKGQ
jgi:hypothetical protein